MLLLGWSIVRIGLPPLAAMFNSSGTAYAAPGRTGSRAIESRFVLWFNGNGIPEKYWIPRQTGADFEFTPCLAPLTPYRQDIHVITGLDSPAARLPDTSGIICDRFRFSRRRSASGISTNIFSRGFLVPHRIAVLVDRSPAIRAGGRMFASERGHNRMNRVRLVIGTGRLPL